MPPFVLKSMFKKYSLKGKMSDLLNKVIKTFHLRGREKQNRRQENCSVSVLAGLVL